MARKKRHFEKPRQIWMGSTEAAQYAGVCPLTIRRWAKNGLVMMERSRHKSNAYVYRKSDIDRIIGCDS